jgi:hypothetical protein
LSFIYLFIHSYDTQWVPIGYQLGIIGGGKKFKSTWGILEEKKAFHFLQRESILENKMPDKILRIIKMLKELARPS